VPPVFHLRAPLTTAHRFERAAAIRHRFQRRPKRRCELEAADGVASVVVAGRLDAAGATELDDTLRRAHAVATTVVLDLGEVSMIELAGVQAIVAADLRVRAEGGRLLLHCGDTEIGRYLASLGLNNTLELAENAP
jgi:anti-anti-sigma factor